MSLSLVPGNTETKPRNDPEGETELNLVKGWSLTISEISYTTSNTRWSQTIT